MLLQFLYGQRLPSMEQCGTILERHGKAARAVREFVLELVGVADRFQAAALLRHCVGLMVAEMQVWFGLD